MGKIIKHIIDINSIIEFEMSEKERLELVNHILYSCTSCNVLKTFTKDFINGIGEVEIEGKNRKMVIDACDVIVRSL